MHALLARIPQALSYVLCGKKDRGDRHKPAARLPRDVFWDQQRVTVAKGGGLAPPRDQS